MHPKTIRALLSVVIIGGALSALLFTTMRENADYYKEVDEVMTTPEQWYGKSMNLHGFVVDGSIEKRPNSLDYRFKVENGEFAVLASYTGTVPDTFRDGAEVVLTGTLGPEGFQVKRDGVMAKCPSKYDPAQTPGATYAPAQTAGADPAHGAGGTYDPVTHGTGTASAPAQPRPPSPYDAVRSTGR